MSALLFFLVIGTLALITEPTTLTRFHSLSLKTFSAWPLLQLGCIIL